MIYQGTKQYKISDEEVTTVTSKKTDRTIAYVNKDAKLSEITKDEGVANIYMFWGNGCPHCKAQWEFLESIRKQYPNDFAVYGFEVWYNSENRELLNKFAEAMGVDTPKSVPYTIIGNQVMTGFTSAEANGEDFIKAIQDAKKSGVDVYFDKVKK